MGAIITTNKLSKSFSTGGTQLHIIKNLDIEIEEGAFTVVMGPSGSGKSTLLYAISGMDRPTLGEVWFGGRNIAGLSQDELAVFRRRNCGFVFQQIHLIESMSVAENVLASGLLVTRDKKAVAAKAAGLFGSVGLGEELWGKLPSQLSGGEAQRVGIVRALINSPAVLFADEPTGSLNSAAGEAVMNVIVKLNRLGQSVVMVTHDLKTASRGSRIIYLRDGSVHGEFRLPPYEGDSRGTEGTAGGGDLQKDAQRIESLQKFLSEMGW